MKRIFAAVLVLALAFSIVATPAAAQTTTTTTTSTYSFNMNLTMGSRGADVVNLQSFLETKGLLTMPAGVAKGYFGGLTRSAVAAYQVSKGITPAAGYFGPITRASVSAEMAGSTTTTTTSTVPGCVAGATFSSTTGQPCTTTTTSTVPGCAAGASYSSTTGQPCNTTTTTTTSGVEGTTEVYLAPTPANNSNVQTSTDVPVLGLEFRAKIANVSVQTVDLKVAVTSTYGTENPATLINTIKVWDGSNVIATIPVNSASFNRDSASVYYMRISGLNFLVAKDTTKVLTISFSTNSIDAERTVVVSGYGTQSIRVVSGNGISSFYNASELSRQHIFKRPGTATLTLSSVANQLRSQNYRVNTTDTAIVPMVNVNLKSETGPSKITTVVATSSVSGVASTDLVYYLYDGSTLLDSRTGSTSVTFANLNVLVSADTTKTLSVKVGFPATTTGVYRATTTVTSVTYEKPNGSTADASGSAVVGAAQYVYIDSPMITLASTPTIIVQNGGFSGATSSMSAKFNLNIAPQGGDWYRANAVATIGWALASNPSTILATSSAAVNRVDNIAEGASATVEFSGDVFNYTSGITAGSYVAKITSITWKVGDTTVTQTYGLEDFVTPASPTFND